MGIGNAGDNSRDLSINSRIKAVTRWLEDLTGTKFCLQTVTAYGDGFGASPINLQPPLQAVISVNYIDLNGIDQLLASPGYLASTVENRLTPAYPNTCWPQARCQDESVRIVYTSGYANADLIPTEIKEAIMFTVASYEQYQAAIESGVRPMTVPFAALQLIQYYRDMRGWF